MNIDIDGMIESQVRAVTAKYEEDIARIKGLLQKRLDHLRLKQLVFKAVAKKHQISESSHFSVIPLESLGELNPRYNSYEDFDGYPCYISRSSSRQTVDVYYYQVVTNVQKTQS